MITHGVQRATQYPTESIRRTIEYINEREQDEQEILFARTVGPWTVPDSFVMPKRKGRKS